MNSSQIVNQLMFDWEKFSDNEIISLVQSFPSKLLRWLAANHPDNKTRKLFLVITGVEIGEGSVINQNFIISDNYKSLLKIGNRVAISPNVTILCASAPNNSRLCSNNYVMENLICEKEVIIGDDVWIGSNTVIMPGVIIHEKSIIGAGSVVTTSVPSSSIYAGIPAKKIRDI